MSKATEMISGVFNTDGSDDRDLCRIENLMLDYSTQENQELTHRIKYLENGLLIVKEWLKAPSEIDSAVQHIDHLLLPKKQNECDPPIK